MKIAIVDDHKILNELLKRSLLEIDFIESVVTFNIPADFLNSINNSDLLITDMMMPKMSGFELITACRKRRKKNDLIILVLSTLNDAYSIKEAIKLGANGYLAKDSSIEELVEAIRLTQVKPQKAYIGKELIDILVQSSLNGDETLSLSPREKNILQLICEGSSVKEIASKENLTINTINSYIQQLMRKMNVNRTPDLILKAIHLGLFKPGLNSKYL